MRRLAVQRRHCLWPPRSCDHPHTSRYHGVLESASLHNQAHLQSRWLISRRLPRPVAVARKPSRFSQSGYGPDFGRDLSCHTLTCVDARSNSPCRPFLHALATTRISPTWTYDSGRPTTGGASMMARSTRTAGSQARRGFHTAAARRASPAANSAGLSRVPDISHVLEAEPSPRGTKAAAAALDPESDEEVPADVKEVTESLSRPPPVNSDFLPLPWKGRLGYVSE
jgi:UV DNA damage endonuclease